MKIGLSSYTYGWWVGVPEACPEHPLDAFTLVEKARELDVPVVQIADNLPLHTMTDNDLDRLQEKISGAGLIMELGMRGIMPENLDIYLPLCKKFNASLLRAVIDAPGFTPSVKEIITLLAGLLPRLEEAGVTLALENHDRFRADEFRQVIEGCGSDRVGICLDTVNSFGALEGPEVIINTLVPYTVNLHIKDFTVERLSHLMGFSIHGAQAGQGRLDIPDLLNRLKAAGKDPSVILEQWVPPADSIEKTVQKEQQWAQASLAYLKTIL